MKPSKQAYIWCKNIHVETVFTHVGTAYIWNSLPDVPEVLRTRWFIGRRIPRSFPVRSIWLLQQKQNKFSFLLIFSTVFQHVL